MLKYLRGYACYIYDLFLVNRKCSARNCKYTSLWRCWVRIYKYHRKLHARISIQLVMLNSIITPITVDGYVFLCNCTEVFWLIFFNKLINHFEKHIFFTTLIFNQKLSSK